MAKLYLKFEQAVLKQYELKDGSAMTIGRLPDNGVHIDNLAVSGHHARILWEGDHFVLEDNNSLNGTFVNNRRINRAALRHGDLVLIGKHTISFTDEARRELADQRPAETQPAAMPQADATVVLDTRKAKEMMSQPAAPGHTSPSMAFKDRDGQLHVIDGKTDQHQYLLSGKLTVIGKSDMASVKLKGWFAPKVAAVINKNEGRYFVAAQDRDVKVRVNDEEISGK